MVLQRRRHLFSTPCEHLWPQIELGRPSVAGPVFARVFGPQTGVQKNHFFDPLKEFGKLVRVENCWGESVWPV